MAAVGLGVPAVKFDFRVAQPGAFRHGGEMEKPLVDRRGLGGPAQGEECFALAEAGGRDEVGGRGRSGVGHARIAVERIRPVFGGSLRLRAPENGFQVAGGLGGWRGGFRVEQRQRAGGVGPGKARAHEREHSGAARGGRGVGLEKRAQLVRRDFRQTFVERACPLVKERIGREREADFLFRRRRRRGDWRGQAVGLRGSGGA